MGDIEQQSTLGGKQCLRAVSHLVKRPGQLPEFILALQADARGEVTSAEAVYGQLQLPHGFGQMAREGITEK